jgi:nucleoid-associated protein YgaU
MTYWQKTFSHIAITAFAGLPVFSHAQTIGWMDRLFTFREEQKPLVAPRRQVAPNYVLQPHYGPADHVGWSEFYSRPDLVAQDYMAGSASKVMRPRPEDMTLNTQDNGHFSKLSERALANAREAMESNIQIGEPGDSTSQYDGRVGRKTQIGDPVNDWKIRDKTKLNSRPGDFEFEAPIARDEGLAGGGNVVAVTAPVFSAKSDKMPMRSISSGASGSDGKVSQYTVETGDTLGSISAKPVIYNDWKLWPLIYSANRKAIGRNPAQIKVNQILEIPRDYTEEQAAAARRKSGAK